MGKDHPRSTQNKKDLQSTLCFKKERTPKTCWHNFIKTGPLRRIFPEDASAFNCGLIAFEKVDMGWVPTVQFPWQQQHHTGERIREANTRPELKPLVVKVWGWLPTDHCWQGPYQWRKRLQACVQTKGQHFEVAVICTCAYCLLFALTQNFWR